MGRSSNARNRWKHLQESKKRKLQQDLATQLPNPTSITTESVDSNSQKKIKGITAIIILIGSFVGFYLSIVSFIKYINTPEEKHYKADDYRRGILLPDDVTDNTEIEFSISSSIYGKSVEQLKWGIENVYYRGFDMGDNDLTIGVIYKDHTLYFTTRMLNLEAEEEIGKMDANSWVLYQPNFRDYYWDNKTLEVIDENGNVVFSVVLESDRKIYIQGYFITKNHVFVFSKKNMNIFDKDDKSKDAALKAIKKIQQINPHPYRNRMTMPIILLALIILSIIIFYSVKTIKKNCKFLDSFTSFKDV